MYAVSRTSSLAGVAGRRIMHSSSTKLKQTSTTVVRQQSSSTKIVKPAAPAVVKESFAKRSPFLFQLGVATTKTMGADLLTQMAAEGKSLSEVDWKRNGIFVVFGFAYLGGFQYWLMVTKYRQWFPTMDRFAKLSMVDKLKDKAGILDAIKMVIFDVTVHLPMIYFPVYYSVKEFVSGKSWNPVDWLSDGCAKYRGNVKEDLTAMIQLWGPSDCIQFVLPLHIRMPFRHLISFFWTAYVSFTRGSYTEPEGGSDLLENPSVVTTSRQPTRAVAVAKKVEES
mmetsp:Transcript_21019/g.34757  ORF Transcript_21019/g.34757 Transcript_21019/m.34757 type:complete len:281 (+) Transcript_21019:202-1044(+)|eukprot:CAMPEP_0119020952 /NCGR_PEP_ID=MMETSP1176-20130426/25043_1 /TAXON_ID=265551 /ORGANISM="Synedropsis recta cf, Strain CCMP1620" /LENGTH=280 /DNA_ID=CAMNT_0006975463 /DNA_START=123 /DNA_END=965 /DNA_ORIENTATION=-